MENFWECIVSINFDLPCALYYLLLNRKRQLIVELIHPTIV